LEEDRAMDLAPRRYAEVALVQPRGRIDHATVQAFDDALDPVLAEMADGSALVVDLSALEYISSVGLRSFMLAERQLRERQARLLVTGLHGVVREIFAISRFDRVLTVAATVDDALAQCSDAARSARASASERSA
jgi:anti-anti-sigma factor